MKEFRKMIVWAGTACSILLVAVFIAGPVAENAGWPTPLSRTMIPILTVLILGPFAWLLTIPSLVLCWWHSKTIWARVGFFVVNLAGSVMSGACVVMAYKLARMGPINPG